MSHDFICDGSLGDNGSQGQSPTARVRIRTEKRLLYAKELAEKELSRVLGIWRNTVEDTNSVLADDADLKLL